MGNDLKPVLLTGAAGYLGGHVLAKLQARGISCFPTSLSGTVGESCNLTDAAAVNALIKRVDPSLVIHCAAIVPKSGASYNDSGAADASVEMLEILADAARCPIVFASSMTVYSSVTVFPVMEDDFEPPAAGYARGKWLAEQILMRRNCAGDVVLRLPGLFGYPRRSGVLYNAAKTFLAGNQFELSSPTELWAAMAVEDAAEYFVKVAVTPTDLPVQAVNVGYEGDFNIVSAVSQVAKECNVEWTPPSAKVRSFSMRLERLKARYGLLNATFQQRLKDLVNNVRQDIALDSACVIR